MKWKNLMKMNILLKLITLNLAKNKFKKLLNKNQKLKINNTKILLKIDT